MTSWILDTGPLVAFFDRSDKAHAWTREAWARAPVPMLTCEAVLAEAAYLLAEHANLPRARVLALIERKLLIAPFHIDEHCGSISRLLDRYADQKMQLADACLVRMSELKKDCFVFTLDTKDFRVYRRFDRQVIPLIAPLDP